MIGKYRNSFLCPHFLLFLLQFSSSLSYFVRLNWSSPQIGHFLRSSYSDPRYRMQSFLHVWIFSTSKPNRHIICFASKMVSGTALTWGNMSLRSVIMSVNKYLKLQLLHLLLAFNWKSFTIANNHMY
jgi:hypothetical protein